MLDDEHCPTTHQRQGKIQWIKKWSPDPSIPKPRTPWQRRWWCHSLINRGWYCSCSGMCASVHHWPCCLHSLGHLYDVTEAEMGSGGSSRTVVSALEQCPSAHWRLCVRVASAAQHPGALSPLLITKYNICRLCSFPKGERSPGWHHPDPGNLE
jgi:hypothetical protein